MEKTVNERLKIFLKYLDISNVNFGKKVGRSKQQVGHWVKDGVSIPMQVLSETIALYPKLNARWLMTGEGKMLLGDYKQAEPEKLEANDQSPGYPCLLCKEKDERILLLKELVKSKQEKIDYLEGNHVKNGTCG